MTDDGPAADAEMEAFTGAAKDRDAFTIGAGLNLFAGDGVSGTVEAMHVVGRENQKETSVRLIGRIDF